LLVVDDELGPREALRMVFRDDYDLLFAQDGPAAMALAEEQCVDVVMLDIRLGRMSGIEVLERLKQMDPGIEVIMMTAFETTDTLREAIRLRALDYVNKPFQDLRAIRTTVADAMRRRLLRSQGGADAKIDALETELQNQRMEQQMARTRGDIYASIIHDINGPLSVINGFVQLIGQRAEQRECLEGAELEFVRQKLQTVARQVGNCSEIAQRYLGFLRQKPGEPSCVPVSTLLGDFEHLAVVHPSAGSHQLVVSAPTEPCLVNMVGTDFIQMLLNLTVNAFQAGNQPCRVVVTVDLVGEPIDLTALKDSPERRLVNLERFENTAPLLRASVKDNGPGIPPDVLPRIFQAYFTSKGPSGGTGLGLNIVVRLVREVGGLLQVRSRPGEDTEFVVHVPAVLPGNRPAA
jgi:signal transduction histidine kinase